MLLHSWVESANSTNTHFPLNNLPYGVYSKNSDQRRCCVAIGEFVLDITKLEEKGIHHLRQFHYLIKGIGIPLWRPDQTIGINLDRK